MSWSSRGGRPGRAPNLVRAVAVLAAVGGLLAAMPAAAHSILVGTSPAPGTQVEALAEVRLDFAGDVAAEGHVVSVATSDGEVAAASYERPQSSSVIAHFDATVPDGAHEIVWAVMGADGHRERGRIPITVAAPAPTTAPPTTAPPATDAPGTTAPRAASSSPATSRSGGAEGESAAGAGDEEDGDGGVPAALVAGIAVVAAAAGAAALAYRARREGSASS